MKLLLQILWGWSVLANGAVGIQVGTIQTNNQNYKLMKMNFTSPVWLQSASNVGGGEKEYISFVDATGNPTLMELTAIGKVKIQSIYNGQPTIQELTNPTETTVQIQSDANTEVMLYGEITKLACFAGEGSFTDLTSIDVSHARKLTTLFCQENKLTSIDVSANTALVEFNCESNDLTELDVSTNTALTFLSCGYNQLTSLDIRENAALTRLFCDGNQFTTIYGIGVNESVAQKIATAITDATSVDGTVTLRQGDEFNQTIIDAAMEKGWDVQYYS